MMIWVGTWPLGLAVVFVSVPGPLQSVHKAEFWEVILALQAADGVHPGVDNLGAVRRVGRLLDGNVGSRAGGLVTDGDLIFFIGRMLRLRGLDSVRIAEVEGHADEGMVRDDPEGLECQPSAPRPPLLNPVLLVDLKDLHHPPAEPDELDYPRSAPPVPLLPSAPGPARQ